LGSLSDKLFGSLVVDKTALLLLTVICRQFKPNNGYILSYDL
jgi:hypothetical protein